VYSVYIFVVIYEHGTVRLSCIHVSVSLTMTVIVAAICLFVVIVIIVVIVLILRSVILTTVIHQNEVCKQPSRLLL